MNMDEPTIAALPPNLMAEARRVHEYIRNDRQRDQLQERQRNIFPGEDELGGYIGGRRRREELERLARAGQNPLEKTIEEVVNTRMT